MAPFDGALPSPDEAAERFVSLMLPAVEIGTRLLWDKTVTGDNVSNPQDLAAVLSVFIGEIARTARREGNVTDGIKYSTFSIVSRGLCALLNRTPPEVWHDAATLEAHKAAILEELVAGYEHTVRTRVLNKKPM